MEPFLIDTDTHRPVPFRQHTYAGCVSLSLANIFNNRKFTFGIEDLKVGERLVDANKKLAEFEPYCYLEPVFYTNHMAAYGRLTDPWMLEQRINTQERIITAEFARPLLVTVVKQPDMDKPFVRYHSFAVFQDMADNMFYVIDSLNVHIRRMLSTQLIAQYHIVGIDGFGLWDNPNPSNVMFLRKETLTHILNEQPRPVGTEPPLSKN